MPGPNDEIIVTANPSTPVEINSTNPNIPVQIQATILAQAFASQPHFTQNADVTGDDIVVTGNKIKDRMANYYIWMGLRQPGPLPVPCVGETWNTEMQSILGHMSFNVTTENFGEGRAGQNKASQTDNSVVIQINKDSLLGYAKLNTGIDFLIAHELAHSLASMQKYDLQMWTEYINGPGNGLSAADQITQYPSSQQFKNNESRANTIARYLMGLLGAAPLNPDPLNGYQAC